MPINEGGLPEHRSEHQAPRRQSPTIIPNATAEPPSERSVFGEPARRPPDQGTFKTCARGYAGSRRFTSKSTLSLSLPRIGQAAIRRTATFFTKP